MNIFMEPNIFYDDIPDKGMAKSYLDFFALAQKLRIKLGTKAYLLDHYISRLLNAVNESHANDASEDGLESISSLYAICRAALQPDGKILHPFFEEGKDFILSHPLTFQEKETKTEIYIALLAHGYMESSVKSYREYLQQALDQIFDSLGLNDLYETICGLLGSEASMEELNALFYKQFLTVSAMAVYLNQLNNQLVDSLAYRDIETSLQVFQLIMEFDLFKEEAYDGL